MKYIVILTLFLAALSCNKPSEDTQNLPNTDQYITCEIGGTKGTLTSTNDLLGCTVIGTRIIIGGANMSSTEFFIFGFNGERTSGTFKAVECQINLNGKTYSTQGHQIWIKVTSFGRDGDKIMGSYSGTISDGANTHPIKGDYKLTIN